MTSLPGDTNITAARLEAIRRLAVHLVRGDDAIDDLVQDTCLTTLEHGARARRGLPWMRGVARNLARRRHRDHTRRTRRETLAARGEQVPSTLASVTQIEALRDLMKHLAALPAAQQQVIRMRYLEDLPPRRIAAQLDMPVATVKSHLRRGMDRLRRDLDAQHGGDRARWGALLLGPAGFTGSAGVAWAAWAVGAAVLAAAGVLWLLAADDGASGGSASALLAIDARAAREVEPTLLGRAPSDAEEPTAGASAPGLLERTLTGRVLDASSGAPIAGARVFLAYPDERFVLPARVVRTDTTGAFAVTSICNGTRTLRTIADGYLPGALGLPAGPCEAPPVLRLRAGVPIEGLLTDDAGGIIADAAVWCAEGQVERAWPATDSIFVANEETLGARTRSDKNGRFVLRGLRPDTVYRLLAAKDGFAAMEEGESSGDARSGERDARIVLFRLTRLDVRLVDDASGETLPMDFGSVGCKPPAGQTRVGIWSPAWGSVESPTPTDYLRHRYRSQFGPRGRPPARLRFTLSAAAVFHEAAERVVEVDWGSVTRHELRVTRKPKFAWQLVRLSARFKGGRPYEGLLCPFEAWRAGMGMIRFAGGRADRSLHLPVGRRNMLPWVFRRGGRQCLVTRYEQLEIKPQRGEFVASWELDANPVRVRVLDARERPVVHFALGVEQLDRPGVGRVAWVTPWDGVGYTDGRAQDQGHGFLDDRTWLAPGRWKVHVNGYALGAGTTTVKCSGDGAPIDVIVRLVPPALPRDRNATPPR